MTRTTTTPAHNDQYATQLLARGRTLTWITQHTAWTRDQLLTIAKAHDLTHAPTADRFNTDAPTADRDACIVDNIFAGLDRATRNHPEPTDQPRHDQARQRSHDNHINDLRGALRVALTAEAHLLRAAAQREYARQIEANLNARLAERRATKGNPVNR